MNSLSGIHFGCEDFFNNSVTPYHSAICGVAYISDSLFNDLTLHVIKCHKRDLYKCVSTLLNNTGEN